MIFFFFGDFILERGHKFMLTKQPSPLLKKELTPASYLSTILVLFNKKFTGKMYTSGRIQTQIARIEGEHLTASQSFIFTKEHLPIHCFVFLSFSLSPTLDFQLCSIPCFHFDITVMHLRRGSNILPNTMKIVFKLHQRLFGYSRSGTQLTGREKNNIRENMAN